MNGTVVEKSIVGPYLASKIFGQSLNPNIVYKPVTCEERERFTMRLVNPDVVTLEEIKRHVTDLHLSQGFGLVEKSYGDLNFQKGESIRSVTLTYCSFQTSTLCATVHEFFSPITTR